jgi:ubiquinone/menaquinone biosynthesis C-methylase UbiE
MTFASRATILWLILCLPNCLAANETGSKGRHDATSHRTFEDVERWVKVFDDPERDEWQKPSEVVAALDLSPGSTVADLGAGTGYFSRYLSRAVGERGTVFAVDVEERLIEHIRKRAELEKTPNVIPVLASADDPRLPYGSIDVVLIVDTYHHFNDRLTYFRRLARALERGGRIVVIDWFKRELAKGPPLAHKLPRKQVVEEMTTAGYELVGEPSLLPYQYFLIFERRR